jgi:hypothetical protein
MCLYIPLINFCMAEQVFMTLGMYIMTYFLNPSHQFVCIYVYHHIVARQRLGTNVTAATKTRQ